jgi:hypothetical protein
VTDDECYRMEFRELVKVASDGKDQSKDQLNSWNWVWPTIVPGGLDEQQTFSCPKVASFPVRPENSTYTPPPADMCSCLEDNTLCQFQMYGSKSVVAQPEIMLVNWYNPDEAVEFLKFDVYLANEIGWVGAGAPQDGTVKMNFRLRNKEQDSDSDDDSDEDDDDNDPEDDDDNDPEDDDENDPEDDDNLIRISTKIQQGRKLALSERMAVRGLKQEPPDDEDDDEDDEDDNEDDDSDDDTDSDDGSDSDDEMRCENLDMFLSSVPYSESGLPVTLTSEVKDDCSLSISTWNEAFESGYEMIDPAIGLGEMPSSSDGLSSGAIAGIVLGTLTVGAAGAFVGKRQYDKRKAYSGMKSDNVALTSSFSNNV